MAGKLEEKGKRREVLGKPFLAELHTCGGDWLVGFKQLEEF